MWNSRMCMVTESIFISVKSTSLKINEDMMCACMFQNNSWMPGEISTKLCTQDLESEVK